MNTRVRAVVVSDTSAGLVAQLEHDADIAVVGQAASGAAALALVVETHPDIVIIDLNLSDGSCQQAIEQIMHRDPIPILALSTPLDTRRSPSAVEALVAGALDAIPRPRHWTVEQGAELRDSVRRLSKTWVIRHLRGGLDGGAVAAATKPRPGQQRPVVAIAASTGGPSALAIVLADLVGLAAPVLIVQHLHPDFVDGLREWMSRVSALPVEIACHRQVAEPGRVYLAPGDVHLRLGPNHRLELGPEPRTSAHRPSADVLFASVAEYSGSAGVGVVLTGMGDDGARGLLELRRRGGQVLAQDESSSAVFGMPRAAQRIGAVTELSALGQVAPSVRRAVRMLARSR